MCLLPASYNDDIIPHLLPLPRPPFSLSSYSEEEQQEAKEEEEAKEGEEEEGE